MLETHPILSPERFEDEYGIRDWWEQHKTEICRAFEEEARYCTVSGSQPIRRMSEQNLCFVMDRIPLPLGFHIVNGRLTREARYDQTFLEFPTHHYAMRGRVVFDLTPGQFVDVPPVVNATVYPGYRVGELLNKAPDIIIPLSDQIVALCGHVNTVRSQLGFRYQH
jgi:hypothetical protein